MMIPRMPHGRASSADQQSAKLAVRYQRRTPFSPLVGDVELRSGVDALLVELIGAVDQEFLARADFGAHQHFEGLFS